MAVEDSGLVRLPAKGDDAGQPNTSDSASAEWQVGTAGGVKSIYVTHWVPDSAQGDTLLELESQISDIIHDAP
jgi:hypothetical protein